LHCWHGCTSGFCGKKYRKFFPDLHKTACWIAYLTTILSEPRCPRLEDFPATALERPSIECFTKSAGILIPDVEIGLR